MCLETLVQKIAEMEARVDSFFSDVLMNNFSMIDDTVFDEVRKASLDTMKRIISLTNNAEIVMTQNIDLVSRVRNVNMRLCRVEQHYYGQHAVA